MTTNETRVPLCEGDADVNGNGVCTGPNVQTYRAKAPGSKNWVTARWCDECANTARATGYRVRRITVPVDD